MRQRSAEEIVVIYLMKKTIVGLFEKEKITQELREATRNGFQGFVAFYQPVIEAKSGRLSGAESLMRFTLQSLEWYLQ